MEFAEEPGGYQKTILSDLQGAWSVFRQAVVDTGGFKDWDRVLFHTDEAMSWETVRNLSRMPPLLLIIRNLCIQNAVSEEIMQCLEDITNILDEAPQKYPG